MNSLGTLFRVSVLGESHGTCVGALVDGCPAGLSLSAHEFEADLARRRAGAKGTTPRMEADIPLLKSGVFEGKTSGAPILVLFENSNVQSQSYEKMKATPRPGHADLVAHQKFGGFQDYRGGGHFSGRLTAAVVAAGVIAKKVIAPVSVDARVTHVGGSPDINGTIDRVLQEGDSVGGLVECVIRGLPVGLGEPFFNSVESLLAHAVFSIPAIKGIEFGTGFRAATMKGSEHNDPIVSAQGATATNNAGGINGGLTNGNQVVCRVAVKPTSSIKKPMNSVDLLSGNAVELKVEGRHDACIALRVPPVLEAMASIVVADLMLLEQRIPRVWRQ